MPPPRPPARTPTRTATRTPTRTAARRGVRRVHDRVAPETRTDLFQVLKSVVATVLAWVLAVRVLHLDQAFLAPWVALLTVRATVYRTVWGGAQTVVASFVGIGVSYVAVLLLGYHLAAAPALALAVLVGLLLSGLFLHRDEGVAVATTALFVIAAGYAAQEELLLDRFLDTLVGVVVGVLVNVLLVPPLDEHVAAQALEEVTAGLGALLARMASELRTDVDDTVSQGWLDATRDLDDRLERARERVRFTQETRWANPLRHRSPRSLDPDPASRVLQRLQDGVSQARAMARVVHESLLRADEWDTEFRRRWTDLLRQVATRVADPDLDAEDARPAIDRLVDDLSDDVLPQRHWPVYGALLTALTHVAATADDVAARPLAGRAT